MNDASQIGGEIEKITYRNEDNGWTVFRLNMPDQGPVMVTGSFPNLNEGEYVELQGQWVQHKSYGRQFKCQRRLALKTAEGIRRYLASPFVHGIGEKTAQKIVGHFGVDSIRILDEEPERLKEVPTIGEKKLQAILEAWKENQHQRHVELFLVGHGLSHRQALKVMQKYQSQTIPLVTENPYRLAADISRIGFLTADKIAQKIGIAQDSMERITAAITYQLQQAEDSGHLFLTTEQLVQELQSTLSLPSTVLIDKIPMCLHNLNVQGTIVSQAVEGGQHHGQTVHYQTELLLAELNVARKLRTLVQSKRVPDPEQVEKWLSQFNQTNGTTLSDHQLQAVRLALTARVSVLTGGPGVGKTTTANAIIQIFKALNYSVALCAPTGRAAQRLSELSQMPAMTIHRLLEWAPQVGGFQRNQHNPLLAQVVIVDESSMLDIRLADALLDAISDQAQIIFIGDVDQLPSVGPGNFLRDLIQSGTIPFTRLTEIFRQAKTSLIIQAAHAINRGEYPTFGEEAGTDCRFITVDQPLGIRKVIRDLATDILPRKLGFDAIRDIQILTPMNRGDLGTQALNDELQQFLNPPQNADEDYKAQSTVFRPGDKVIQTVNNYELGVFNGDIGFVTQCRTAMGKVTVQFAERTVNYDAENVFDLKLAYAITIHKSQGSEFPVVILPITMQHFVMLQRNLVYTGLTRARKLAIFVGTKSALEQAIRMQPSDQRQTRLIEMLQQQTMRPAESSLC